MKTVRFLILAVIFAARVLAADVAPAFPTELKLTNGAVLHKCEVVRWKTDSVVVRHVGGTDPIRFANIAADQRAEVEAARKAAIDAQAAQSTPAHAPTNAKKERVYKGQVFVATMGGKNTKLGSVNVRAFPMSVMALFEGFSDTVALPKPLASTVTDADGKFTLAVPGNEPFFIFSQSGRYLGSYRGTPQSEHYDWRIPSEEITDPSNVLLNNRNMAQRNFNVTVEE